MVYNDIVSDKLSAIYIGVYVSRVRLPHHTSLSARDRSSRPQAKLPVPQ